MLHHLINHSIARRLTVVALTLAFLIYGAWAYFHTPIEAYPDVTNVQINIIAQVPGLAPEEIERQVTVPLERALNGTPGMRILRSESLFGLSLIWLTFEDDIDSFRARTQVNERLAGAEIPDEADVELAPDFTPLGRVYYYRLVSDRHTLHEMRAEQEWTVSRVMRQVPGVADISSLGGYLKEFHVEADPERLASYGLTLFDLSEALERSNLNVGGGFLANGEQELVIRSIGYIDQSQDILDVVLKSDHGTPVTVEDVAKLVLSNTPRRGAVGFNEEMDVVQGIIFLGRGENPSVVLENIHEKVDELNDNILPEGMQIEPIYDRSELVGHTLETVHTNLFHGVMLIIGLVWLFLRSLRASMIVITIIPLSLLTAFAGLHYLDLPANLISMGAIDFGILVDGAVVLVENVMAQARQHRPESRKEMLKLVASSALDVARPTFYAMAIIIAALIPVFTLESVEGRIFRPLALTYSFALVGALVFSLTVVPALCAIFLRPEDAAGAEFAFVDKLRSAYQKSIQFVMSQRLMMLGAAAALLVGGALTITQLGSEFLPELDEGDAYVFVEMPPSISLEEGQTILLDVRRRLLDFPEVISAVAEQGRPEDGTDNEGVNMAKVFVKLKTRDQWRADLTKGELVDQMRRAVSPIPGVSFNFSQPIKDTVEETVAGVRGQVVLKIYGTDLAAMREALVDSMEVLNDIEGVVDLDLYRDSLVPQLQIQIDRQALAREGIAMADVQSIIETSLAGQIVTQMWESERPVPIRVRLPFSDRSDPTRIEQLMVPTPSGGTIALKELADIDIELGRTFIPREQNSRYLALKFNVEGRDLGSVIQESISQVNEHVELPEDHIFEWGGEFENQERAMARLSLIIPVSLVIIFILLFAALHCWRSAVAILLVAPFALTGGAFALYLSGVVLSVSAAIGFIALLGQISLLGLLVLSAISSEQERGTPDHKAIIQGATNRFRAVLMAALLAAMGLVPMATSTGLGSETQRPFAVVIVGGMITTFLVATYLLPVVYSFIGPRGKAES